MPATLAHPGVYVEEIPSGVRAITGVSTSVTAFVGPARWGPVNRAVRVLGFADFERAFGGLEPDSLMSYAVRQFFLNGGGEAWIIRIAKNAQTATCSLKRADGQGVLNLAAKDAGEAGNQITVRVDHKTSNPGSTFNLTVGFAPEGGTAVVETFTNLSMNSHDPRYVVGVVEAESRLVKAVRADPMHADVAAAKGRSTSGDLSGAGALWDGSHKSFQIAVNGGAAKSVTVPAPVGSTLGDLASAIQTGLDAALGVGVVSAAVAGNRLTITSSQAGEKSSVRVFPGLTNDLSRPLKLGVQFGGEEVEAAAVIRPALCPAPVFIKGGALAAETELDAVPSAHKSLEVVLDGLRKEITIEGVDVTGTIGVRLQAVAERLQQKVRDARPGDHRFQAFSASVEDSTRLVLTSLSRGAGASIQVLKSGADDLADRLKLTPAAGADVSSAIGRDVTLEGKRAEALAMNNAFNEFVGSRAERTGIYALEAVDLFNLLVLAGVSDVGILSEAAAYCKERRAFLIVDAHELDEKPDAMEKRITQGAELPRTNHAAVYYPWVEVADPLNGGRGRKVPPSGTIAGVFARTDAVTGVWKAPAGTDAVLVGVRGVTHLLTDGENGVLNPRGVNCLRVFPAYGPVAWGARTLEGDDQAASEWKYVPVRRTALFLEESLYRGTKWAIFAPNDEALWAQLRLNIGAFMHDLFRKGAFAGTSPRAAYFVKCDGETTTPLDVDRGVVNVIIGFAPLKPAEFVVLKFQQMAGQART